MTARSKDPNDLNDSNGSPDPGDLSELKDPAEAIESALARLRRRRPSFPPGAERGHRTHHGPHGHHGDHGDGDDDRIHGWAHRGPGGPPRREEHEASPSSNELDGWDQRGSEGSGQRGRRGGRGGPRFGGPARMRMLDALATAPEPLTVSEIADAVGVDQPRASRLVQQSVKLGLVRREADQDDARRTRVVLTDEGRALVRSLRGERRAAIDTALEGFSSAERKELARLLTRFADDWPQA